MTVNDLGRAPGCGATPNGVFVFIEVLSGWGKGLACLEVGGKRVGEGVYGASKKGLENIVNVKEGASECWRLYVRTNSKVEKEVPKPLEAVEGSIIEYF